MPDTNYKENILKLLLGCYILTPPLRREILEMKFIKEPTTNAGSYCLIADDKIEFILNNNIKNHQKVRYDIKNQQLIDLIRNSYKLYERDLLIPSLKNKDKDISTVIKQKYFKLINEKLGVNIMRQIYFSKFNINDTPLNEYFMNTLKSRTSLNNALTYYTKK